VTYKDFMKEKIDAVTDLRKEKRHYIEQVQRIQDKLNDLEARRQTLRKGLHRDHQKPEQIR
jgi:uncharacterized coiled-coil DUF342 family protein